MRALAVVVLAGTLALSASTVIAGNKGGVGRSGTPSSGHASGEGLHNTNGQWSPDPDQGLDRAQERRSDNAIDHSNSLDAHRRTGGHGGDGHRRK